MAKQTLEQAVHLAKTGKSKSLVIAAKSLLGCPVGGWGQTAQARLQVREELPLRSQRDYTLDEFIAAAYTTNSTDRYVSKLFSE